jgi:hypothetical protein
MSLQDWENLCRFVNGAPPLFGTVGVRDPDYLCEEYDALGYDGSGKCLSDGHYECVNCSKLAPNAPRFENDGGRGDRLRLFWLRPRRAKGQDDAAL